MSKLSRTTKILGGGLILSLGLNLFLAGLIAGKLFRDRNLLVSPQLASRVVRPMDRLPVADRRKLEKAMKLRRDSIARDFRNMRRARSRVVRIISKNKYTNRNLKRPCRRSAKFRKKPRPPSIK